MTQLHFYLMQGRSFQKIQFMLALSNVDNSVDNFFLLLITLWITRVEVHFMSKMNRFSRAIAFIYLSIFIYLYLIKYRPIKVERKHS